MMNSLPSESFLHLRDFKALKITFCTTELRYETARALNG